METPNRLIVGLAYGVLFVLGLGLGVLGSFEFSWMLGGMPVAAVGLAVVNLLGFRLAGWAMRGRLAPTAMTVPWLIVVVMLASRRPEGDLVVTGTTPGYTFILGGAIGALVAIAWTPATRSWLVPSGDLTHR